MLRFPHESEGHSLILTRLSSHEVAHAVTEQFAQFVTRSMIEPFYMGHTLCCKYPVE